jgi:lysine-N-methylase
MHTVPEWLEILSGLEILDEKWGKLIAEALCLPQIHSAAAFDRSFENLLVYFLFRHASLAESKENMRAAIAFSILGVEIIKYLFVRSEKCDIDTLVSLARLYSSEIEYSEDNTAELIFELESGMI